MRYDLPPAPSSVFSERLRETRENLGLSQQALSNRLRAEGVKLSRVQISQLETDPGRAARLRLDHAMALCVALGVAPDRMLTPIEAAATVAVTPQRSVLAGAMRLWLAGAWPLTGDDAATRRRFFTTGIDEDELQARAQEADRRGDAGAPAAFDAARDDQATAA